jgi:hypothetical protein
MSRTLVRRITAAIALTLALVPALGHAAEPKAPRWSPDGDPAYPLDVGGSFGWNSPGGLRGFELDYRVFDHVSLGTGLGEGLWGLRITPHARIYPLGIQRAGLFLEGGVSFNSGDFPWTEKVTLEGVEITRNPTRVANAALGYRFVIQKRGWLAVRAGWGFALTPDAYSAAAPLSDAATRAMRISQPGGVILGISGGFSL